MFFSHRCCQMMRKLPKLSPPARRYRINIVFMIVSTELDARTINIKDILGQLNYIGSSGHFQFVYRFQSACYFLHDCIMLVEPSVMCDDFKIYFISLRTLRKYPKRSQALANSHPPPHDSFFLFFCSFFIFSHLSKVSSPSHQLLLFIGRLELSCGMNTNFLPFSA